MHTKIRFYLSRKNQENQSSMKKNILLFHTHTYMRIHVDTHIYYMYKAKMEEEIIVEKILNATYVHAESLSSHWM